MVEMKEKNLNNERNERLDSLKNELRIQIKNKTSFEINLIYPPYKQLNMLASQVRALQNENLDSNEIKDSNSFNLFTELKKTLRSKCKIKINEIQEMSEDQVLIELKELKKDY